jgi:phage shock protein C
MSEVKRLYRARDERMLAGVCGGLAKYFNVDPTLIRVLFVLATLPGGPGLLAYIVLAIIMPEEPVDYAAAPPAPAAKSEEPEAEESE